MNIISKIVLVVGFSLITTLSPVPGVAEPAKIGIVIMHGKGGSPNMYVDYLASALEGRGLLVANIEMPWSGKRDYDVNVSAAEQEVEAALSDLRAKGAQKLFVSGHSQGGVFALHFAGKHNINGVICIAPGGSVGSKLFREKLGDVVAEARQMVSSGKGSEKTRLYDFEGKKGKYPIVTTPENYLSWFDPDGAMNSQRAARELSSSMPVLWIVAGQDYPGLRRTNIPLFKKLPSNPHTRLYEPAADHKGAPSASVEEITRWTSDVAASE